MTATDITTIISTVGFPITCCVAMAFYINTTLKDFDKTMERNTIVLERLMERLGVSDGQKKDS